METLIQSVSKLLIERGKTMAVAESCTGGLLSSYFTSVSGSSSYFIGGIVSYHPSIKSRELNIPLDLLRESGSVSQEVAIRMAQGIRRRYQTDFGIGITGVAGPTGGTSEKPVGLVYAAVCSKNETAGAKFQFHGERNQIRNQACFETLRLFMQKLLDWKDGSS